MSTYISSEVCSNNQQPIDSKIVGIMRRYTPGAVIWQWCPCLGFCGDADPIIKCPVKALLLSETEYIVSVKLARIYHL